MTKCNIGVILVPMTPNLANFIPDMQSVIHADCEGFVLFCENQNRADKIRRQLYRDFHIFAMLDYDNIDAHYIIPLDTPDENNITEFIRRGWDWDKNQKFIQYTITLYGAAATRKMHNTLVANRYNVIMAPNNMQLVVKCLDNSPRNSEIKKLQNDLLLAQKSAPQSIDDYFNKLLFCGKIENVAYRTTRKQEFSIDEIEANKDIIVRGILYQYFNKRIRSRLAQITFPKKFDANKLDNKEKQNINLIRDFLYAKAAEYVDMQTINASNTKHDVIIRFDYLKSCNQYDQFRTTLKSAHQWFQKQTEDNREMMKNKEQSMNQAYKVMDCDNGYYFVILFGADALQYCGKHMHHCVQNAYWANAIKQDGQELYSLRDPNGEPHLTLEIKDGVVLQCQGRTNTAPNPMFREIVRKFIEKNKFEIPDVNGWNKHIAYLKHNGKLYDVFNLPENFTVSNSLVDLCGMGLDKLPDMSTVTVTGGFSCATNNLSDLTGAPKIVYGDCQFGKNPLVSLRGLPREITGNIYLSGTQLTSKSFVPIYTNLDAISGVDEKIITAWREQIEKRKSGLANIIASLSQRQKAE